MDTIQKKCPYCGEIILVNAKKCKYCREWLEKPIEENIESSPDETSTDVKLSCSEGQFQEPSSLVNLRKCRHCGKEVAATAEVCPNCGGKRPGLTSTQNANIIFFAVVISLIFGIWMWNTCQKSFEGLDRAGKDLESSMEDLRKSGRDLERSLENLRRK